MWELLLEQSPPAFDVRLQLFAKSSSLVSGYLFDFCIHVGSQILFLTLSFAGRLSPRLHVARFESRLSAFPFDSGLLHRLSIA